MNSMELDITAKVEGDYSIVSVKGEIDLYSSTMLREYMLTTMKQRSSHGLIVELAEVSYIDSSGIATMVEGLQLANKSAIKFKVAGLSPRVLEVFELMRLEQVFDIYDSVEEALNSA